MGLELTTDLGPRTIIWTDTFDPYGVEVFASPIGEHLHLSADGPEGWTVDDHPLWRARKDQPIDEASTFWELVNFGESRRSDGTVVSPPRSVEVPVAFRLDFEAGPVWLVAGQPGSPDNDETFVGGDEIMVVFTHTQMAKIGFPDTDFVRT